MKNVLLLIALVFSFNTFAGQSYQIDNKKSDLKWTGKKVTGKHFGKITFKSGEIKVKEGQLVGGEFVVDMTSITVDDIDGEWQAKLLKHLNSNDFFNVNKYKKSVLKITKVTKDGENYKINADLTIKGKTHPVSFDAKIDMQEKMISSKGGLVFDRTKYDIKYGSGKFFQDLGDKMIYDDVQLDFTIVAKQN
jgi:polyisoprenoid-binding protein YceI